MASNDARRSIEAFSPDYAAARDRFRTAAAALGFAHEAHPIEAVGAGGEELTIDVALSPGAEAPTSTVVFSSGLHGVEGYLGSAVQLDILERVIREERPAPSTRVVLLHALNPFGFAHGRRVDEDNVDLNRNFLASDEEYGGAPDGYAALDRFLNPRTKPGVELYLLRTLSRMFPKSRLAAFKTVVASGQYEFPNGLFFGGSRRSRLVHLLEEQLARWLGPSRRVFHVDFHTGLGAWGTHSLLLNRPSATTGLRAFEANVPDPGRLQVLDAMGVAYRISGGFGDWCQARFSDAERAYDFVTAEFGTYHVVWVLEALRRENRAFHHLRADPAELAEAKASLLEIFAPKDAAWRSRVLEDGVAVARAAIRAAGVAT